MRQFLPRSGTGNGQFKEPNGLAVDGGGHVFVADTSNNRIQKFDDGGTFLIAWGSGGGGNGHFSDPTAVAVDTAGNVFVTDLLNERVQAFDGNGRFLTTWTAAGSEQLDSPHGVAVDGRGDVFVADTNSHRIEKFSCPTPPPYDIAGHWSGMERQGHMALASISADFTSLSAKKFTGVFTGEALSCTVSGKHLKVFKSSARVQRRNPYRAEGEARQGNADHHRHLQAVRAWQARTRGNVHADEGVRVSREGTRGSDRRRPGAWGVARPDRRAGRRGRGTGPGRDCGRRPGE